MHKFLFAALPLITPALLAQGTPEVEANDTAATATVLGLGAQGDGAVGAAMDVDFWKITLAGSRDLRVWLNPGTGPQAGRLQDSDLTLFAANGTTQIAFNDDVSGTTNWLSRLVVGGLAAGDYYLRVRSSAAYFVSGTGRYTIDVIAAVPGTYAPAAPPLTLVDEAAENNDPRPAFGSGVATPSVLFTHNSGSTIAGGANGTGGAITGKDYDLYAFTVVAIGTHTFSTLASPTATAPVVDDTVIHLLDSSFVQLAYNDDSGGAYSFLTYNITTPGTYYISVTGYYAASAGNYLLDILGPLPPVPTGAATVTIHAGGCAGTTLQTRLSETTGPQVRTEVPVLGSAFYLDGAGMEPFAPVFRVLGCGVLGAPFDLAAVGGPAACFVEVDPLAVVLILADGGGNDAWALSTPANVGLIGLPIEQQLVAMHSTQGLVASNRVASVCGITN